MVGSHKLGNEKWSKGYAKIKKSCGCLLGKKCDCLVKSDKMVPDLVGR